MKFDEAKILEVCEAAASELNFMLIEVLFRQAGGSVHIEVYIDNIESVTIEQCAEMSRAIAKGYEAMFAAELPYRIDVSTPGIGRNFKFPQQLPKHLGRTLELKYREGAEVKKLSGTLTALNGDLLTIEAETETAVIPFSSIIKSVVKVRFS